MELGGNAPFLVFDDADLDAAVEGALAAKLRNGGEACVAANRFLVHDTIAGEFTARLVGTDGADYRVGRGTEPGLHAGAARRRGGHAREGADLVADAVDDGARDRAGGGSRAGPGYFYQPTVLTDVPRGARILGEEIFGRSPRSRRSGRRTRRSDSANATEYGLVCFAYTRDLNRALRLAERLETGMLGRQRRASSRTRPPRSAA